MLEARVPFVLYNLVHVIHHEAVRKMPLKQWGDEQDLVTAIASNEHAAWRRHDVVIDGILLHGWSNVVACHHRVFVDGLHLSKMSLFEVEGCAVFLTWLPCPGSGDSYV